MTRDDHPFAAGHEHDSVWSTRNPSLRVALRSVKTIAEADRALSVTNAEREATRELATASRMDDVVTAAATTVLATAALPPLAEQVADAEVHERLHARLFTVIDTIARLVVSERHNAFKASSDAVLTNLGAQLDKVIAAAAKIDVSELPHDAHDAIARNRHELYAKAQALAAEYGSIREAQQRVDRTIRGRSLSPVYEHARRWTNVIDMAGGPTRASAALRNDYIKVDGEPVYPKLAAPPEPGDLAELLWLAAGNATAWVPTRAQLDAACNELWEAKTMHAVLRSHHTTSRTQR